MLHQVALLNCGKALCKVFSHAGVHSILSINEQCQKIVNKETAIIHFTFFVEPVKLSTTAS